jgi:transposase-like protein
LIGRIPLQHKHCHKSESAVIRCHYHHDGSPDRSIHERAIALAQKGGLSVRTAAELNGVPISTAREQLRKYRRDGQVGRREGTGLWSVSSTAQDAALEAEAERNPFSVQEILKLLLAFLGKKRDYFETSGSKSQGKACCGEGAYQ